MEEEEEQHRQVVRTKNINEKARELTDREIEEEDVDDNDDDEDKEEDEGEEE